MKSTGETVSMSGGRTLHAITLRHNNGMWIGDVVLDYNDGEHRGKLHTITDYGNYGCRWAAVPRCGFEKFVADMDADYMLDNLSRFHDEARVCDIDKTAKVLAELILIRSGDEGAEYLGDALDGLNRVESERELWDWQARHREIVEPDDVQDSISYRRGGFLQGYQKVLIPALQAYLVEAAQ
ncbi:MAG: hypothetical protein RR296_01010 [Clostridia bacterium]